ncbi:MAG: HAD family hydrolase [Planctomycetes bacterium]|jgi:HAD superfamily hydrolase (TIGR01450 family)|nr:HAD family hydrolase [Planctomycetota bacterium]MDP6424770.1 HAD-IIA family hydrolase [Planctomycetota bacterium]
MKAIILAAGVGSRLRPITDDKPKTLVRVVGKPILGHLLDALAGNGITEVAIVVGYRAEQVRDYCATAHPNLDISFVVNNEYDSTNNMFSLWLAREHLTGDVLLMNGDVVFDSDLIAGLAAMTGSAVAVDRGTWDEESMKVLVEDGRISGISKTYGATESWGRSTDAYRLDAVGLTRVVGELERIIGSGDRNQWTERMLDNLFRSGELTATPCEIGEARWYEIDTYDDLAEAELMFNERLASLADKKVFFVDRDGTLTLSDTILDGAEGFLSRLKSTGRQVYVLTNNSSRSPGAHASNLRRIGFDVSEADVLVSIQAALHYLKRQRLTRLYWLANEEVSNYIRSEGFEFDEESPEACLLTYDTDLTFAKLGKLTSLVRSGIPYYATHLDVVCPTPHGDLPDIGTFMKVVEMTTGQMPLRTFGKPDPDFITGVLEAAGIALEDAVVIGDRLYTDIALGADPRLTSVLVLSGETTRSDYEFADVDADVVVRSVGTLMNYL